MKRNQKHENALKPDKLKKALKFLILFNLFSIPLYIILLSGATLPPLQSMTAQLVWCTLRSVGIDAGLDDINISIQEPLGGFSGHISWDCTGWKSMLAFAALVLATNERPRKKIMGIALLPLVYAANIFRISIVFIFVSMYGSQYFQLIHSLLFSGFMVAFIICLWFLWLRYFKEN